MKCSHEGGSTLVIVRWNHWERVLERVLELPLIEQEAKAAAGRKGAAHSSHRVALHALSCAAGRPPARCTDSALPAHRLLLSTSLSTQRELCLQLPREAFGAAGEGAVLVVPYIEKPLRGMARRGTRDFSLTVTSSLGQPTLEHSWVKLTSVVHRFRISAETAVRARLTCLTERLDRHVCACLPQHAQHRRGVVRAVPSMLARVLGPPSAA